MTETLKQKLDRLSEAATPGEWVPEHEGGPENFWGKSNTGVWSKELFEAALKNSDHEDDAMDDAWVLGIWGSLDQSDLADTEIIAELMNAYRSGDLVTREEVEGMGDEPALRDVQAERQRQKAVEGWTPSHDDEHTDGSLAMAAACYANPMSITIDGFGMVLSGAPVETEDEYAGTPIGWPDSWDVSWWKPTTPRRDLVKAAALILAEIERLDRAALRTDKEDQRNA